MSVLSNSHKATSRCGLSRTGIFLVVLVVVAVVVYGWAAWRSVPNRIGTVATAPTSAPAAPPREQIPPPPPVGAASSELAAWIRPHKSEERWLQIDWHSSIREAQQIAQQTQRLVFVWAVNEPMGRC